MNKMKLRVNDGFKVEMGIARIDPAIFSVLNLNTEVVKMNENTTIYCQKIAYNGEI